MTSYRTTRAFAVASSNPSLEQLRYELAICEWNLDAERRGADEIAEERDRLRAEIRRADDDVRYYRLRAERLCVELEAAREALSKIHIEHRSHITIGPIEGYAHIKMTCDHWPMVEGWEVLIDRANRLAKHTMLNIGADRPNVGTRKPRP